MELTKKTRVQENRFFFRVWSDQDEMSGTAILEGGELSESVTFCRKGNLPLCKRSQLYAEGVAICKRS